MLKKFIFILSYVLFGTICHAQEIIFEEDERSIYEIVENDTIFQIVEEAPIYPGAGLSDLFEYIGSKLVYPEDAINKGIEGRVVVSFIINTDGSMTDFIVEKSVDPTLDNEAIRVLKSVPHKWIPAKQKGKTVRIKYTLPINFTIPNEMKTDGLIAWQFISANLDENYEFQIIELEPVKRFDYEIFKNQYVTPTVMEDKAAENQKILDEIKIFARQNPIDSYISLIIGTRPKGSDVAWTPEWYFLFLDSDRNVLDIFYYYP